MRVRLRRNPLVVALTERPPIDWMTTDIEAPDLPEIRVPTVIEPGYVRFVRTNRLENGHRFYDEQIGSVRMLL